IDVEHGRLTSLEHDDLIALERFGDEMTGVGHHRAQTLCVGEQIIDDLVYGDGAAVEDLHEQVVLLIECAFDLLTQDVLVEEVLYADADAVDLVGVRRSDAAARGADLPFAEEALGDLVEGAVILRDEVRVRTHAQARDVDAACGQDRKSTRLNSSHVKISYAVICLKKKHKNTANI